jgi:hypothetical protein
VRVHVYVESPFLALAKKLDDIVEVLFVILSTAKKGKSCERRISAVLISRREGMFDSRSFVFD